MNIIQPIMANCSQRAEISNEQGGHKSLKGFLKEGREWGAGKRVGMVTLPLSGLLGGKTVRLVFL